MSREQRAKSKSQNAAQLAIMVGCFGFFFGVTKMSIVNKVFFTARKAHQAFNSL
jgi:hypothetical protein